MKFIRYATVLFIATVLAFAALGAGGGGVGADSVPRWEKLPERCTVQTFRPFSAAVWDKDLWERKALPADVRASQIARLGCAPPAHKQAMKNTWRSDKRSFYKHRAAERFRVQVTPFYGGGNWWAIPYTMVICESGGRYHVTHGAYSMTTPAWNLYSGPSRTGSSLAGGASERWQDIIAAEHWARYGEGGWECKADGSIYW